MNFTSTPQEVNPLQVIIETANQAGRQFPHQTIHQNDKGKVILRADMRGYLLLEVWLKNEGPTHRLTAAFWQFQNGGSWVLSTSQERAQEWLTEAAEILGESPFPSPVDPIDQAAADFVAQAGTDYDGRVARAVELAKAGHTRFPRYETYFNPAGKSGFYQCACQDASYRNVRSFIGQTCKHSICLWLVNQVSQDAEAVAVRKLSDRIELARQRETALPVGVSAKGRMKDYLG